MKLLGEAPSQAGRHPTGPTLDNGPSESPIMVSWPSLQSSPFSGSPALLPPAPSLRPPLTGINPGQHTAFYAITQVCEDPSQSQQLFLIHGPGGTGKNFVYNALTAKA